MFILNNSQLRISFPVRPVHERKPIGRLRTAGRSFNVEDVEGTNQLLQVARLEKMLRAPSVVGRHYNMLIRWSVPLEIILMKLNNNNTINNNN